MEERINQSGSVVVAVIVAVVVTALLVGGGVYVWQKQVGKNQMSSEFTKMQTNNRNITTNKLDDLKSIKTSKYIVAVNDGLDNSRPMILVSDTDGDVVLKLFDQEALPGVMGIRGIDKGGKFFYQCNNSGYAEGRVDVYDLKTRKIIFTESDSDNNILDQCKYNSDDNTLSYIIADSWDNMGRGYINAIKKVYSFDNGSIIVDKNTRQDYVLNGDENATKSEIDNWLTFKDQDFGIEFKYPKQYLVKGIEKESVNRNNNIIKTEAVFIENKDSNINSGYRIYKSKKDIIGVYSTGFKNGFINILINGLKYKMYQMEGMGEPYGYVIKKNGYFYTFEAVFAPKGSEKFQIFEDIMKTVKFK